MLGWFVGQAMKASGGKANPQASQRDPDFHCQKYRLKLF
jgi:hypothetical protein